MWYLYTVITAYSGAVEPEYAVMAVYKYRKGVAVQYPWAGKINIGIWEVFDFVETEKFKVEDGGTNGEHTDGVLVH